MILAEEERRRLTLEAEAIQIKVDGTFTEKQCKNTQDGI